MHQTRKFGGSLKFSELSAKVKAWKQSSQQEDAFDKLMRATTEKTDAELKLEVMGQEEGIRLVRSIWCNGVAHDSMSMTMTVPYTVWHQDSRPNDYSGLLFWEQELKNK